MTEALPNKLVPYSPEFPDALREYCEKAADAIRDNKHHDHRRHLFISFLGGGLGIKVDEIELERKIKAGSVRGRIDAFYRECIIEAYPHPGVPYYHFEGLLNASSPGSYYDEHIRGKYK